jgi:uncharacterized protein with HEPN domain
MYEYDRELLAERLEAALEWLERIPVRLEGISSPEDFTASPEGLTRMDAICMTLIAVGEEFKNIDRKTQGGLFAQYPEIDWRGVIGVRDVMAHGYMQVNVLQLFGICRDDVPRLIETVRKLIADVKRGQ